MKILLDTCTFLWLILRSPRLSGRARKAFGDPANDVFMSAVSAWEIAVKHSLGRLTMPNPVGQFTRDQREAHGIEALPLSEEAALHLAKLPGLHADPFDRMLVCQALIDGLTILTPDEAIAQYPVRVMW